MAPIYIYIDINGDDWGMVYRHYSSLSQENTTHIKLHYNPLNPLKSKGTMKAQFNPLSPLNSISISEIPSNFNKNKIEIPLTKPCLAMPCPWSPGFAPRLRYGPILPGRRHAGGRWAHHPGLYLLGTLAKGRNEPRSQSPGIG